jgi:hypothetical protein
MNRYWIIATISVILSLLLWISGMLFWTSVGLGFTLYVFLKLMSDMGKTIPVIELMASLAALQWILGPVIEYNKSFHHYKYFMYVEEARYMAFVVPALLAFWAGSRIFRARSTLDGINAEVRDLLDEYPFFPYVIIAIGILVPYLAQLFPASMGFVFFLLSTLKYIGVIYLIQSDSPFRWLIFWGLMLLTVVTSVETAMFHDLLLWAMLLFTFLSREWKLKMPGKMAFAVIGILLAITIQGVKLEYRYAIRQGGYPGSRTGLFLNLVTDEWRTGEIFMPSFEVDMNVRLNQGWIISSVMYNVPRFEPYARGNTIREGITSSVIPRILAPEKRVAGGRDNFRQFTGLSISDDTSMGISIAGEGWANYGWLGGIVFMFLWGLFIGWFWRAFERLNRLFPTLLIWSPMLFLQVVKAETEFGVVLNHLVKSSVVVIGLIILIKWIWGLKPVFERETPDTLSKLDDGQ